MARFDAREVELKWTEQPCFRTTTRTRTKVNLLVFLTPHIIRDASDFKRVVERKMKERAKVVEQLEGERPGPERTIDFGRKQGPLAAIARVLAREQRRPEHGGLGEPSDTRVEPREGEAVPVGASR